MINLRYSNPLMKIDDHDTVNTRDTFILKYGGLGLYRRTTPLFLGLVLGEFAADSIISIEVTTWKIPTYIWYG